MKTIRLVIICLTGVLLSCSGSIPETPGSVDIPNGCVTWFDGCNRCLVVEGKIEGCTKKRCPEGYTKPPRCLHISQGEVIFSAHHYSTLTVDKKTAYPSRLITLDFLWFYPVSPDLPT